MMMKNTPASRSRLAAKIMTLVLAQATAFLFMLVSVWRSGRGRANTIGIALSVVAMTFIGNAYAQMAGTGNTNPDTIINNAVCGGNGWLTWFTSTKFLVVLLVAGLIGFFLGRAIGKRDNDGIMGTFVAVLGLGAIRILVKIVTAC